MRARERVVVDTGVLISRLMLPKSVPAQAVSKVAKHGQLLASAATLEELTDVLARPKFDPYVTVTERQKFLRLLGRLVEQVPIIHRVEECRDPKDDKFLELAINGRADVIVTGDDGLLVLSPYHDVPIITPAAYMERD
ncbi:MAG: putative toxin-antitoxin system toxin component, PIN family [Candidatus Binatia bacterium]